MNICYLSNQYPKVSHTFIRREIVALEFLGVSVLRVCARQNSEGLVDPLDIAELDKVHSIAQGKLPQVFLACLATLLVSPISFLRALKTAIGLAVKDGFRIHKYAIYLAEACYLKKLCRQHKVDHIHAHFATNPAVVALLCRVLGGPSYSFTVHGPEEFDRPESLSLGAKIAGSSFVAAISYFCQSQLYRWCLSLDDWKKITIVRCALDDSSFEKVTPIAPGNRRFLAIGRLSEQKGFPLLLESLKNLKHEGLDFHVDIVGDGPMRQELAAYIDAHGLSACVTILGYKSGEEVRQLLDQSCCLLVPSFAEGLPVVIMESFARARPVVTTQIAAMSELVKDGENGWIIPPGDTLSIENSIKNILKLDDETLNAMGQKGKVRVYEQHNSLNEAKKLREQFNQVIQKRMKAE